MEMTLRPPQQSSLGPRSKAALVIRPTRSGGSHHVQFFLMTGRFTGSRIVRCMVASSDSPSKKSRRMVSPHIKVTSRGYAPRLTVESSTQKGEHENSNEETLTGYNMLLSNDVRGWTDSKDAETAKLDLIQNASSSSIMPDMDVDDENTFGMDMTKNTTNNATLRKVDVVDEAIIEEDIFNVELFGTTLSSVSIGEVLGVDEASGDGEEDIFKVGLSENVSNNTIMRKVDVVDEAGTIEDTFKMDLSGIILSNPTMEGVDSINLFDEAEVVQDSFDADLPGHVLSSTTMGKVHPSDEADVVQDTFHINLPENVSSGAQMGEANLVDEIDVIQGMFDIDLSENVMGGATLGEVDCVDQVGVEQYMLNADLSANVMSSSTMRKVDVVDEVGDDQHSVEEHLKGSILSGATYEEANFVDESNSIENKFEEDLAGNILSSAKYGEVDALAKTRAKQVTSKIDLLRDASSSVRPREVDEVIEAMAVKGTFVMDLLGTVFSNAKHMTGYPVEESTINEDIFQNQYSSLSSSSIEDKTNDKTYVSSMPYLMPLVGFRQQGNLISINEEKEGSYATFHEKEQLMDKQDQNQSYVDLTEQNEPIIDSHEQDKAIVNVPKQIQSIVGPSKQEQSIVSFCKQDRSIVSATRQKQSIVGFDKQELSVVSLRKQNLSIVGISNKDQTNKVVVDGKYDVLHGKKREAKDRDVTSQKINKDTFDIKFVVGNLLEKDKTRKSEESLLMTTRKRFGEEHFFMPEDHTTYDEEEQPITMDKFSLAGDGITIGDKLQHVLSEEEFSCAKDEVELIENNEQYIQESPHDYVDPETLRRMLQELADKNYSMGVKLFVFPEVVKPNSIIDIYFNRDLTTLASEPDVLMKGAFNDWRWKHFTERLHKSELGGVWWSCKLYIPKEAYRLDFVFFNGRLVYENNNNNNFMIQVESTMDQDMFEDFLAKEKKLELERLAIEEAKRMRQTEEQRRKEEERVANEAIRAQVKAEIQMKKIKLRNMLSSAKTCADNLWYIEARPNGKGDMIRLYYNRNSRPLGNSTDIWMHGGYNNWNDGLSFVERLIECDNKDGDWWYADVTIPEKALVLDWVFADGAPGKARNYDNNGRQDFHAILPNKIDEENYWDEDELSIYTRLVQERREREEAIRIKAERSAKMKAEMKAKTMRRFLLSQKHIVYTEPLEIHAGTTVDVLYNPSNTVLNGKPEVWFRCSFNLWMHPAGALPPQKMVRARDGMLLKATVSVPPDAYMMDFVFSESEEGGIYDNRNGTDYHIPVAGSVATKTHLHIVHIAVEMAPIAKVGGLGDVVTSLSRAVQDLGHTVEVILPKHDCLNQNSVKNLRVYRSFTWSDVEIKVWVGLVEDLTVYFLEPQNGMFGVGCVYGRNDDRRFGFFCHSALEFILQNGSSPHIIHCHDWSSAPVAWLYKEHYAQSRLGSARVVFTIHNLEFGAHYIGKAMTFCDKATTVSHTYSKEVQGHGAIAPHRGKFYGILNGIDPDIWDPYTDDFIPVPYTPENVVEGKHAAKRALQQKLGLQQTDVPIVGIISRLTAQKGIHLIKHAIHRTLESNGQVVLLGSAPDHRIQGDFCRLADELHGVYHGRVRLVLTYDEPLSHLIYAGSDFILVPSIFEPCGLTQLVAMRYGSIPVVRRTGGLYDTVFDVDHDKDRARSLGLEPNGFGFDGADSNGVDYALNRAIGAWFEAREWFHSLCKRVMEQDWSWNRPALDYIELYHSARKF